MLKNGKFGTPLSFSAYQIELNSNNGNCGKFAIDGQTFKVPCLTNGMVIAQGTNIGEYSKGGLPNIKGTTDGGYAGWSSSGAFYDTDSTHDSFGSGKSGFAIRGFDASLSNSVYGSANTVIPNHMKYPYYIVLSNKFPEASQTDWNNFVGNLSNKANIDLSNVTIPVNGGAQGVDYVIEYRVNFSYDNSWECWYRKWKSGWVEQGGHISLNERVQKEQKLPIEMASVPYWTQCTAATEAAPGNTETLAANVHWHTTTIIRFNTCYIDPNQITVCWEVKGWAKT